MRSEPRSARTPVWPLSISLAATLEIDKFSFSSSPYLDVSVQAVPLHTLWIGVWMHEVCSCGFPHSDICGSMDICSSPQLFAAYHVFLRLLVPRHPPCALSCLTSYQLYFIALKYRVLRFKNASGKFLYRFVIGFANFRLLFLGCLDKKSFINLCMKFSRYQQSLLRRANSISRNGAHALEVATQLLRHSTFSKSDLCFLPFCTLKEMFYDSD